MSDDSKKLYLLDIEPIPTLDEQPPAFPAYFVGSTAPNNAEDGVQPVTNPNLTIKEIAQFLKSQPNPELLIAIHGYNTGLGHFATPEHPHGKGVKGWYQDIRNHIATHCAGQTESLVMLGYRWPSEQIKGPGTDSLGNKIGDAVAALPLALRVLSGFAIALLIALAIISTRLLGSIPFVVIGVLLLVPAIVVLSITLTFFLLRIAGYFRDAYRANNFGVPDLVELLRVLDKEIYKLRENPGEPDWKQPRIKVSFIGHSMGAFVVTNTVRILSDVFDQSSIGELRIGLDASRSLSAEVGRVFSLGRLVLVAPDIPAETLISGRSNFLSASLSRFEETYLFSNEGDMALKLASTAANYSSFPARTREGGYRLGNVVVRYPLEPAQRQLQPDAPSQYGLINLDRKDSQLLNVPFLEYLYTLPSTSLKERQDKISGRGAKSIADRFTVFDCTDYQECNAQGKTVGVLSHALGKQFLSFWDYVLLSFAYFTGRIDTHGGYFYSGGTETRPAAEFSKHLIYGLACLGFVAFLENSTYFQPAEGTVQLLAQQCEEHGIQVLLAAERYEQAKSVPLHQ